MKEHLIKPGHVYRGRNGSLRSVESVLEKKDSWHVATMVYWFRADKPVPTKRSTWMRTFKDWAVEDVTGVSVEWADMLTKDELALVNMAEDEGGLYRPTDFIYIIKRLACAAAQREQRDERERAAQPKKQTSNKKPGRRN